MERRSDDAAEELRVRVVISPSALMAVSLLARRGVRSVDSSC